MRIPRRFRLASLVVFVLVSLGLIAWGCTAPGFAPKASQQSLPTAYLQASELKPETLPYEEGFLVLAGTQIPVVIEEVREPKKLTLKIKTNGALIEDEVYEFDETGFRFLAGPGVAFSPAIPLIRYPVKSGETWKWAGTMNQSDSSYKATADITAKNETLNIPAGKFETLYVEVNMRLEVGTPEPAIRLLKFWFVPNQGVLRREFGASSTREPRTPEPSDG